MDADNVPHGNGLSGFAVTAQVALTEQVIQKLVTAIISGVLKPGERLIETKVAADLGVSRGPLREALKVLTGQGLVVTSAGRGTRVAELSIADVENMSLLRAMLEGLAARQFAADASPESRSQLRDVYAEMLKAATDGRENDYKALDSRFHETMVVGSGNRFLVSSWQALRTLLYAYLARSELYHVQPTEVAGRHKAFLDALESGDPVEAEELFRSVILLKAYQNLNKPIPSSIMGYVTRDIRKDGTVMRLR
ncbi:GntR family transcriptional regulator [Lichenihabitans psoromatis]|uniref:GntR family transcriptional regulator n=1 Tax=Lichenihabitans psoromatis TaxID=2528642 RepID=UPI0013F1780C|nr:GntR family transcriptional regulator [Lichenihabitans psoromatis]